MYLDASDFIKRFCHYKKIVVIGNNGSGKSYLSNALAELSGLPLVHLDLLYWRPNWVAPTKEEWVAMQRELIVKEKWIMDGNHTSTMELRYCAAGVVIFLNINRFLCLISVFHRMLSGRTGFPTNLRTGWNKDTFRFLQGLWNFSKERKPLIYQLEQKYPDIPLFCIQKRRNVKAILRELNERESGGNYNE